MNNETSRLPSERSASRVRVFANVALGTAVCAFGLMYAFGSLWGLAPALLFAAFAIVY